MNHNKSNNILPRFLTPARLIPLFWLVIGSGALYFVSSIIPRYGFTVILSVLGEHKILVFLILGFGFVTLTLVWAIGHNIDQQLFVFLNGKKNRPLWLDRLMLCLTQFGNGLFAGALAALLFLYEKMLSFQMILGTITLWLVVEFIKLLIGRSRPYTAIHPIRVVGIREPGGSFPSGHTSQVFFLTSLISAYFMLPPLLTFLLFLLATIVGITRIYVGAHYPRDVLGGAILGTAWGMVGVLVVNVLSQQNIG